MPNADPRSNRIVIDAPVLVPKGDAAARRDWLCQASDSELAQWLASTLPSWRAAATEHGAHVARLVGAPVGEVVASPFGFRACAMGAAVGAAVVHHELRPVWRWDPDLLADAAVADERTGEWVDGALVAGRYEGFCQDLPLATFDPNHSARWTPHELLHRVCGFHWHPDMTRWQLYAAARLGEIVPVAHWYGTDTALRLDRDGFDRESDALFPGADVAAAGWLHGINQQHRMPAAIAGLRTAARWVSAELDAVAQEARIHQTVAVADPLLDSVTDAIAYATGHVQRLRHGVVGSVLEAVTVLGRHRFAERDAYASHVADVFDRLVFGAVQIDPATCAAALAGRVVWDLCVRSAFCDPVVAEEVLAPHLSDIQQACVDGANGDGDAASALVGELTTSLREAGMDELFPIGLCGALEPTEATGRPQLEAGVWSVAPGIVEALASTGIAAGQWVNELDDDVLWTRAPLVSRLKTATQNAEQPVREQAVTAFAIAAATARDDMTERLATPPIEWPADLLGDPTSAVIRANPAFTATERPACYLVGRFGEAVSVFPMPDFVAALWSHLADGPQTVSSCLEVLQAALATAIDTANDTVVDPEWPDDAQSWLRELAEAGAIGWIAG